MTRRRVRVIGLGNALRGDDAVGLVVARRVRELLPGADVLEPSGEPTGLLDALGDGVEHVVLVDAVALGRAAGHRPPSRCQRGRAGRSSATSSTHALGLAEAIELGRALGRLPARLLVYGVEGRSFELGARLSPAVARAADALVVELSGRYGREGDAGC